MNDVMQCMITDSRTFVAKSPYDRSKGAMSWNETQVDQDGTPVASTPKTLALDTDVKSAFVAEVRLHHLRPPFYKAQIECGCLKGTANFSSLFAQNNRRMCMC